MRGETTGTSPRTRRASARKRSKSEPRRKEGKSGMLAVPVSLTKTRKRREKNEDQVSSRAVDRVALVRRCCNCIRPGSNASGEGSRGAIFGIDEEGGSGSDERAVRSAVELQAGAGPLVRGTSDGAHRGGRGFSASAGQGKGHDGAGRRSLPRREKDRRSRAGDGSGPHAQGASAGTAGADKSLRLTGGLDQALCGEPRDDGRFPQEHHRDARSRAGKPDGKAGCI